MLTTQTIPAGDAPATAFEAHAGARTFARRIDCAARADERRAGPRSARGGGHRDPAAWERARTSSR